MAEEIEGIEEVLHVIGEHAEGLVAKIKVKLHKGGKHEKEGFREKMKKKIKAKLHLGGNEGEKEEEEGQETEEAEEEEEEDEESDCGGDD